MPRLAPRIEKIERKLEGFFARNKKKIPQYIGIGLLILYFYGMFIHVVSTGINSVFGTGTKTPELSWDPFVNLPSVFTPVGFGVTVVILIFYCLFTKKGMSFLSGSKAVKDKERGIELLSEGTHGTSGWMESKRMKEVLEIGCLPEMSATIFGKLPSGEYVGMKDLHGMNKNIILYGAPGTGKSRGFFMPFIMSAVKRGESLLLVDTKAEFYELFSKTLEEKEHYFVQAYNLLDLLASDGWNFMTDSSKNTNLVQNVAEVIIRNTSSDSEKNDFWATAEKNLLMALILYVQSLTYPGSDTLLPIEERSLGTIYKILSTTNVNELDAKFRALPPEHPALPPYGIFRQAPHNIWGNIFIGLGSRLNIFQNKLVDSITKHSEIDLTRPGREKCAYFCIISDQDSTLQFLSSMFFSLLFVELFDFARQQPNRRLPVCVNFVLDEYCNIDLLDSKKIWSVARSRNINIQAATQGIAQLSNRYPHNEWQEIVGDADYQVFLGCNDVMTAEYISKLCGDTTVRVSNTSSPMPPLFSPLLTSTRPYTQTETSARRPLMLPDEIRRLPKDQLILIMRGEQPLKLQKITPEEMPEFKKMVSCKATDHIPKWRQKESEQQSAPVSQSDSKVPSCSNMIATDEYMPDETELGLNSPTIPLGEGIDCKTIQEVSPDEI